MKLKELKEVLEKVPDDFEVDIFVNEEGGSASKIYIDDVCNVVEINDFHEQEGRLFDKFYYQIDEGDKVLVAVNDCLKCGTIKSVDLDDNHYKVVVQLRAESEEKHLLLEQGKRSNMIIKFNWRC